jgi:hypothetical protein
MKKAATKPMKQSQPDIRALWLGTFIEWQRVLQSLITEPKKALTAELDIKAFAAYWFSEEAKLLRTDLASTATNEPLAERCYIRLMEWAQARAKWHLLYTLKECPDQADENKEIGAAAFAGLLASDKDSAADQRVTQFLEQAHNGSDAAHQAFKRWVHEPRPERWKYSLLDSWLICIWPLVESQRWSYRDVWLVAQKKFNDDCPMETADRMGSHCKLVLKLQTQNHKAGRPRNDDNSFPPLADLALQIPAELPDNSLFNNR